MKFKRLLVGISIFSFLYAQQANAFFPLAIPVIAAIQTGAIGAALADSALVATAVGTLFVLDSKTNLIGSAVNAIKIFAKGQATTGNPDIVVSVDPKSIPTDAPANWAFDSGTGLTFDPTVNASSSTANPNVGKTVCQVTFGGFTFTGTPSSISSQLSSKYGYYVDSSDYYAGNHDTSDTCSFQSSYWQVTGQVIQSAGSSAPAPGSKPVVDAASPPMWPSDGHCSVVVSNVNGIPTFSGNPQDPDCFTGGNSANAPAPLPPNVSMTGNQIKVNNGPSQTTITLNPDGSVKVISTSPNSAGTATTATTVDLDRPIVGAPGISMPVIGQSTQTFTGTGTQTSSTPITTVGAVDPMTGLPISPSTGSSSSATDPAVIADLNAIKAAELAQKAALDKIADETPALVPGLPAIPKLYTPVYPNGLKGVWNSHSATLQNTAVFKAIAKFVPNWGGGTCPSFQLNLSLASYANYGNQDLSIPCTVWDIVGVLVMLSALFSARRIIFGG